MRVDASDESNGAGSPTAATGRMIRLVLNLAAANDDRLRDTVDRLRHSNRVDVRVAWDPPDAVLFAREAAEAGYDVVAAGGGDGTINAVMSGLLSGPVSAAAPLLGILPFGTANDLATACGLDPEDPVPALELLAGGEPSQIDVGRMNGVPFLNVASGGHAAEVTTETDPDLKRLLGGLAYWLTGISSLARIEPRPIRVAADGFEWSGRVYAVAVCNGRQAGGGLRLAPRALLDDGLLDVAIVPEVPWTEFLKVFSDLKQLDQEGESRPEHIVSCQAAQVLIEAPEGLQMNLDGEPIRGNRFEFTVDPLRLGCLLPEACAPLNRSMREIVQKT